MSGEVDRAVTAALLKEAGWRVVGYTLPIEQDFIENERGAEACRAGSSHAAAQRSPPGMFGALA